jgi:hypothetical protein
MLRPISPETQVREPAKRREVIREERGNYFGGESGRNCIYSSECYMKYAPSAPSSYQDKMTAKYCIGKK